MLQIHVYIHDVQDVLTPNKLWFQRKDVGMFYDWNEILSELTTIINGHQESEEDLGLIHTYDFIGVNYCLNFSVKAIAKMGT